LIWCEAKGSLKKAQMASGEQKSYAPDFNGRKLLESLKEFE
jgi:hypothetical protein